MIAEVLNASKSYTLGEEVIVAVNGAELQVAAGEFACIYGASGSGKTTLLNLVAGIDTPESGEILFDGQPLSSLSEARRADTRLRGIGVVFQSNNLLPEFTALENVALPLLMRGVTSKEAEATAQRALASVGLADLGPRLPGKMSGGQRQRVGIARAFAGDQALLIADEPTGALDSRASTDLFVLMRTLCKSRGAAVVLATHDPLAREFADTLYSMVDGTVTAQ